MTTPPSTSSTRGSLPGAPAVRPWSRAELLLAGVLLALAAAAWVVTDRLATPDMSHGILTGAQPMGGPMRPWLVDVALFLPLWMVMMAAMMLPSIAPFTVGISRLMRAGGAGWGGTATVTVGYFLVWIATGVLAYLALRALDAVAMGPSEAAVRVGAVVLLVAGIYQLTPLKRVCLRHCRSPAFLLIHHGERAVRSRHGAFRVGIEHGGYCLGCCWALMVVLLAAGAMSLVWMGAIAAIIALEKVSGRGDAVGTALGGLLIGLGLVLLIAPGLLTP